MAPIFPLVALAAFVLQLAGCVAPRTSSADSAADPVSPADTGVHGSADREGYYAVIESIVLSASASSRSLATGTAGDDGLPPAYAIRVRFDDRSRKTVKQVGLDGLRVGDSVRIERDRVRRY